MSTKSKLFWIIFFVFALSNSFKGFGQVTIWNEDFESYIDGIQQGLGTPPKWTINPTIGYSDYFEVRSNLFEGSNMDQEGVFTTETIDISSFLNVTVSVEVSELGNSKASDYVNVFYKIDEGIETSFENNGSNTGNFTNATATTTVLNGSSLIVVIKVKNDKSNKYHRFDNIVVEGIPNSPPSCTTPISPTNGETDFAVDNDLTWNSAVGATSYKIIFGTDNPPTNIESGTDLGNVLSYTPSATLDFSTTYYWQIVPENIIGSATGCSVWSFTTGQYCSAGSSTEDEYIDRVQIETIDNNNSGYSIIGYGNFTSLSTDLSQGQTGVQLTLTYGVAYTVDDIGVWVDWNQDGDFNDTGENVVCQVGLASNPETYLFDVPASALLGSTTMRIRMKYDDDDCGTPCGITTYGEVEDYTINVLPYCVSSGKMDYNTSITLVNFNTINNITAKPAGYNDYTSQSTNLTLGNSYNLTVNLNTDGNFINYAIAWIDWNQDGDFSDTGEEFDLGSATNVTDGATTNSPLSVTVPGAAALGSTRMRVSTKWNSSPTSCETDFDGEVEDYSINIISACTNPDIPTITASSNPICSGDNVTLAITGNLNDATLWHIYTGSCGGTQIGTTATSSFVVNDITTTTTYYVRGEGNCVTPGSCESVTVTVQPATIIDIAVIDLGNSCQSGETGSTTVITWDITKNVGSTDDWTYNYAINDGSGNVDSGTNVSATGNIQISYTMNNATATDKTYTITITNVKDNCGVAETETGNNSDTVTMFGVPATSDITTN